MLDVHLDTEGLRRAQELLHRFPEVLKAALKKANVLSAAHILKRMKQVKLVGGNPLNRRTGNLIRSWSVIPPVEEGDGWRGGVGSNSNYAAAHEFGVDKTQNVAVRAYTRRQESRSRYVMNLKRKSGIQQMSQGIAFVHPFTRAQHTKLPARPYARPSFTETADRIKATHHDEIRQAWEKVK